MYPTDISGVTQKGVRHTIYDRWKQEEAIIAAAGGPSSFTRSRPVTEKEKEMIRKLVAAIEGSG